ARELPGVAPVGVLHELGGLVLVLLGQPRLPDVPGLEDVAVTVDDLVAAHGAPPARWGSWSGARRQPRRPGERVSAQLTPVSTLVERRRPARGDPQERWIRFMRVVRTGSPVRPSR